MKNPEQIPLLDLGGGRPLLKAGNDLEAAQTLEELEQTARSCRRCGLREGCRQVVFGEGNPSATLMLVGEGPGEQEDLQGRPFVGPAGQLLDRILAAIGLTRREVYIANIVKCRPPGNRIPFDAEMEACLPLLRSQIRLIKPRLIVCLGATATRGLLGRNLRITQVRGQWFQRDGISYLPTYHPAALLRDPGKKREVWEDFKAVRAAYLEIERGA